MRQLTKKWQILLYAAAGMGVNLLNIMMNSYLCSALLVGGFGADAVQNQTYTGHDLVIPAVWSVFALAAKVLDGVIDIPMAAFTDGLKSRFGRRKTSVLIGFVPMLAAFLLFLAVPDQSGASFGNTLYYGVILCVYYTFYTLTMVSYYATFTEIVGNSDDRSLLANMKSVCDILYFIIGFVAVRAMLNGLNVRTAALVVFPAAFTMLIAVFMMKNETAGDEAQAKGQNVRLFKSLTVTFKNRAFITWMLVFSLMTFGLQLFLGGINEYFSYVGMNMIYVMMAAFAPVPFTLVLYNRILKKKGFGFAFRYVLIVFTVGMSCMFGVGLMKSGTVKTVLSIVTGLFSSFSIGSLFAVSYSVPSQLAYDEQKKNGISNAAMYFAVQGLFAGVASGIGSGVVLTALKGSEKMSSGAIRYLTLVSAVGALAAFLLSFVLPKSVVKMGRKEDR